MYIVGFNGPPRSGKDSIGNDLARIIREEHQAKVEVMALSLPMRLAVFALAGIQYDLRMYETFKDKPLDIFHGKSIREEMIDLSERHVKPRLGQDFWARSLMGHVQPDTQVLVITDIGFTAEAQALSQHHLTTSFLNVHVHRDGYDWLNDSRCYVYGTPYITVNNNDDVPTVARRVYRNARDIMRLVL